MVEYEYADCFADRFHKQLSIVSGDGLIKLTNAETPWEKFELQESLCTKDQLAFGACEASILKFTARNTFISSVGKWLTVQSTSDGKADATLQYGRYKVFSDTLTADRTKRDITAYDAMYDILKADVAAWYNTILPDKDSTVTLRQFRASFITHFGLEEAPADLVNDDMIVCKTIQIVPNEETATTSTVGEALSGRDVITAICEINGCFGHIGRDGKFHYIYLPQAIQGLYPAADLYPDHAPDYLPYQQATGHLYPQSPKGTPVGQNGTYISCKYEDYQCQSITKLQIRMEEGDIGVIVGSGDNCYIIEDNFLVYGKESRELTAIAENILKKITNVVYIPYSLECTGNPCLEVGDPIRLNTKYQIIESYILQRTLKGVQALRDSYSAEGVKQYSERINSTRYDIQKLKGKANVLKRTIEETRLEMYDIDKELRSTISVTASQIRTEVSNTAAGLQTQITQNAGDISLRVRKDNVISSINLSPETITLEAKRIDLKGLVNADELVSKFATIATLNATTANLQNVIAQKATITSLNATNAEIENLKINKLSVSDFTAENISAMNISVRSANVTGGFNANKITSGTISADRIDVNTIASKLSTIESTLLVPRINCSQFLLAELATIKRLSVESFTDASWQSITVGTKSYTVLCKN